MTAPLSRIAASVALSRGIVSQQGVDYLYEKGGKILADGAAAPSFPRQKTAFKKIPVQQASDIARLVTSLEDQMWIAENNSRRGVFTALSENPGLYPEVGKLLFSKIAAEDLSAVCRIQFGPVSELPAARKNFTRETFSAWEKRFRQLFTNEASEFARVLGSSELTDVPVLGFILARHGIGPVLEVLDSHLQDDDRAYSIALHRLVIASFALVHDIVWVRDDWQQLFRSFQQDRVLPVSSLGDVGLYDFDESRNGIGNYDIERVQSVMTQHRVRVFPTANYNYLRANWHPGHSVQFNFYEFAASIPEEMLGWCFDYASPTRVPYLFALVGSIIPIREDVCQRVLADGPLAMVSQFVSRDFPEHLHALHQQLLVRYVDLYLEHCGVSPQRLSEGDLIISPQMEEDAVLTRVCGLWHTGWGSSEEWTARAPKKSLLSGLSRDDLCKFIMVFLMQPRAGYGHWSYSSAYRRDMVHATLALLPHLSQDIICELLAVSLTTSSHGNNLLAEQFSVAVCSAADSVQDWDMFLDVLAAAFDELSIKPEFFAVILAVYIENAHNASSTAFEIATELLSQMSSYMDLVSTFRAVL